MKIYRGRAGSRRVFVDDKPLRLFLNEVNHSPTGFNWGYGGSGPHQLAYAILRDYLRDRERTRRLYHKFCWDIIAKIPQTADLRITAEMIERWLKREEGAA